MSKLEIIEFELYVHEHNHRSDSFANAYQSDLISRLRSLTMILIRKILTSEFDVETSGCDLSWSHLTLCVPSVFGNNSVYQWPYLEWPSLYDEC